MIKLSFESYRYYGEEKLKRPLILKGKKAVWELPIIKRKCKVFELEDGSLVLHMGELFCKQMTFPDAKDMKLPFSALAKKYPTACRKRA